ncbi:hypothetical protein NQ315_016214 [Exocentrus adspersus]|uniref:Chromo domain-containing protein n=1 Tax=Exocentrus adspersus TaxID=1586481 RepID=A0AAV8VJR9_9CUCU|nr:hypothetical protein NQ315_016214 [Exocentrus adspersus]
MKHLKKFNKYATNVKEDIVNELHKPARINFKRHDIVDKYNNTVHSTTRMKPIKVTARNERSLLKSTYTHLKIANKITKFKVGDHDETGKEITGGFNELELQKVKHPDAHLVEKVLRKKGNKVFVKWLGYNDKHNSWIDSNNVL